MAAGLGYDAGGNGRHGLAMVQGDPPHLVAADCAATAGDALDWLTARLEDASGPIAVGIDTLLAWSLGPSGDREAEQRLRAAYPKKARSVMRPNSLFGAMPLSGMAVALRLADTHPGTVMTEVHPGVLAHALRRQGIDEVDRLQGQVEEHVSGEDAVHARDAVACAWAAWNVAQGTWTHDLLAGEDWVSPLRAPRFAWPERI